ncbi:fasciclin domain-containing protein [Flavobacterium piscinae]|uniref:fasciclin domain-containing protein n=1 Tax=Flavobacterium piscinae TaxID=2506424 RepID=UPI002AAB2D2E|nr:fasciclin domain-containing protein [Flavobacterium piscinae]
MTHHVIAGGNVRSSDLTPNGTTTAPSLQGQNLNITLPGTNGNIANITDGSGRTMGIVAVDVQVANGVIHVLNNVLVPDLN